MQIDYRRRFSLLRSPLARLIFHPKIMTNCARSIPRANFLSSPFKQFNFFIPREILVNLDSENKLRVVTWSCLPIAMRLRISGLSSMVWVIVNLRYIHDATLLLAVFHCSECFMKPSVSADSGTDSRTKAVAGDFPV